MTMSKNVTTVIIGIIILVIGIILGAGFSGGNHPTETQDQNIASPSTPPVTSEDVSSEPQSTPSPIEKSTGVCYWDWEFETTSRVGEYYVAPSGYSYVLVDVYLKNEGDTIVSTNPNYWPLTVDGITYTPDTATYSEEINHQTVEVGKGGELETRMAYLVKGNPMEATLSYTGPWLVKMELINVYNATHF